MMLVPLLPAEAAQLLDNAPVEHGIAAAQVQFVRLLAQGLSAAQIARELGISPRTVQRHVARLSGQFGVTTIQQLSAELARRGF
jgi:DNA-binding CsgD family transcriptional regulator